MNLEEMKAAKKEAEIAIRETLNQLQQRTGCHVASVSVSTFEPLGTKPDHLIEINLRVPS